MVVQVGVVEEGGARIGITDFAQDALGDVVYVELPTVGTSVAKGDTVGEVESTKSVSEVYAPVSGEVVAVNGIRPPSPPSRSMSVVWSCCSTAAELTKRSDLKVAWLNTWNTAPTTASGVPQPSARTM